MKTAMLIIMTFAQGGGLGNGASTHTDHIGMASMEVCEAAAKAVRDAFPDWHSSSEHITVAVCINDE